MAVVDGCQWGLPHTGGRPKQCADPVDASVLVVPADTGMKAAMSLCQLHADTLTTRKLGTIYREVNNVPTPVKVTLAELR